MPDLKTWRTDRQLSYAGAARVLGYSRHYIINVEKGRQPMSSTLAGRMALWDEKAPRQPVIVYPALGSTGVDGSIILSSSRICNCGCHARFVPSVWNQKRIPGHPRRRLAR